MNNFSGFLPSATLAFLIAATSSAEAFDVSVSGLRNRDGNVVICVWRRQDRGFPNCGTGQPFKRLTIPATAPGVALNDLPSGEYAISIFHDEKKRDKLETNLLGIPLSGVGLANNPQFGPMNPPTFDKARVSVPNTQTLNISVRYLF